MILKANSCSTCHYMQRENAQSYVCRRFPPTVQQIVTVGAGGRPQVLGAVSSYPGIQLESWCGEFKPRIHTAEG